MATDIANDITSQEETQHRIYTPQEWIQQLYNTGTMPDVELRPVFDNPEIDEIVKDIEEDANTGRWKQVQNAIDQYKRAIPAFATLFEEAPQQTNNNELHIPELPPECKANEALADQASPILDAIIAFFQHWATRSYEGYHEAVAIWVLATIAARRVYLPWRKGVWTNLYIVLVSDSTVNAKTEAASYGRYVIEQCGLGFLLAPDDISPEKWVSKMSGNIYSIPRNYSIMRDEEQERVRMKLAFSAQKGWIYDEFGDFLQEIMKTSGSSKKFYKLLKQLYDNKTTFIYETHARGEETATMPYLSLIGTTPPDSLRPIAQSDSPVWTDGAFSRMAFVVSPDKKPRLKSAPDGEAVLPENIRHALTNWHDRLGIPDCKIIDLAEQEELLREADQTPGKKPERKFKDGPAYTIERQDLPQNAVNWTNSGVHEAHEQYYAALANLAYEHELPGAFKSAYGRLPGMALSIAMLLASLENNNRMDMRHWARGQAIVERWRISFHELVSQLSNGYTGGYGALENAVIDVITKKIKPGEKFNARTIIENGSTLVRTAGSPKVRAVLEEFYGDGTLARDGVGKKAVYQKIEEVKN